MVHTDEIVQKTAINGEGDLARYGFSRGW
jgi:hypothetical protein